MILQHTPRAYAFTWLAGSLTKNLASYWELSKLRREMSESFIGDAVSAETGGRAGDAAFDDDGQRVDGPTAEATEGNQPSVNSQQLERGSTSEPNDSGEQSVARRVGSIRSRRSSKRAPASGRKAQLSSRKARARWPVTQIRQRFGLPDGFVPRWQRFERSILLEQNIYRLPNGNEYVPSHPSGTLGAHQHLYALLTIEQSLSNRRGSVYVRNDGRIFDYSVDSNIPNGDLFDTGYTIYDLERTGRYAPREKPARAKREAARHRKAAAAG